MLNSIEMNSRYKTFVRFYWQKMTKIMLNIWQCAEFFQKYVTFLPHCAIMYSKYFPCTEHSGFSPEKLFIRRTAVRQVSQFKERDSKNG